MNCKDASRLCDEGSPEVRHVLKSLVSIGAELCRGTPRSTGVVRVVLVG